MRAQELYELMDKPLDWQEIEFDPHFAVIGFDVQTKQYTVMIHVHDPDNMIANISFSLARPGSSRLLGKMNQTGTGDPFPVYGTVANILLTYIGKMQLKGVTFSANSTGKIKLYSRLTERLAKKLGWLHRINGNEFELFDPENAWIFKLNEHGGGG